MTSVTGSITAHAPAARDGGASAAIQTLSVVIPVYHSEDTIGPLVDTLVAELAGRYGALEVVLVNDGSTDDSHARASSAARHHGCVKYLRLARNFGEHNAVMCGLAHATGDAVAIIDDDFQNPVSQIPRLVDHLVAHDYDVVYSAYEQKHHSWFRNLGSRFNGAVAARLLDVPEGVYLSSFKVMNAFLVDAVTEYRGPYPYIDGLILRATDAVGSRLVEHAPRTEGRSNYTLRRLVRLWLSMLTGFSIVPLRVASVLGMVMSGLSLLVAAFFVFSALVGGIISDQVIPPGWPSLIVSIMLLGGIQLMVIGMVGEYLGRMWLTQNGTPQYVVRAAVGVEPAEEPVGMRSA